MSCLTVVPSCLIVLPLLLRAPDRPRRKPGAALHHRSDDADDAVWHVCVQGRRRAVIREWIKSGAKDDSPPEAAPEPTVHHQPPVITALRFSPDGKLLRVGDLMWDDRGSRQVQFVRTQRGILYLP